MRDARRLRFAALHCVRVLRRFLRRLLRRLPVADSRPLKVGVGNVHVMAHGHRLGMAQPLRHYRQRELPGLQNTPFMQVLAAHWFRIMTSIVGLVRSLLSIFGGMQMKNLANYPLVMTASIVAIVPCFSECYCLDLPFGIWALVVISGASVRGSFNRAASAM